MHTGETWRLGRRPGLDGLRGIAVALVLFGHSARFLNGWAAGGVTVFFTLSGFLITSLIDEEHHRAGRIDLRRFYARRARRLLPGLAVLVAVVTVGEIVGGRFLWPQLLATVLYLGNVPGMLGANIGPLAHTWSLGVEEQFYLLWPLAVLATGRRRYGPVVVAVVGIVASIALRFALWDGTARSGTRVYYGLDTRLDGLLLGCLLALLLRRGVRIAVPLPVVVAACLVAATVLAWSYSLLVAMVWIATVVPWLTAGVILHAVGAPGLLAHPWLRYLGRRSYALYLWHTPLTLVLPWWAALVAAFAAAEISWRFVEQPFLRRKSADAEVVEVRGQVGRPRLTDDQPHDSRRESGVEATLKGRPVPAVAAQR